MYRVKIGELRLHRDKASSFLHLAPRGPNYCTSDGRSVTGVRTGSFQSRPGECISFYFISFHFVRSFLLSPLLARFPWPEGTHANSDTNAINHKRHPAPTKRPK